MSSYKKPCTRCGAIIYTQDDNPLCGPCRRIIEGKPAMFSSWKAKDWHTLAIIGWGMLVLGPVTCFANLGRPHPEAATLVDIGAVAFFIAPIVIFIGYLGRARTREE